jgi:polysaccharide export outer membrane protein
MLLAANSASEAAYTLGAGDRIRLDLFNVPEYSGEYQVLVDGTLNLPIIGSIRVQGATLGQATAVISNQYARYVRRPIVTLSLLAARPLNIGVSGEVASPGSYTMQLAGGQFPTVTQAVRLAGGTTQSANLRQVQVRRRGAGRVINVNLGQVIETGDLSQDITLRDGDTVFIPTGTNINSAESSLIANSNLGPQASAPRKILVVGEVVHPGTYTVKGESGPSNGTTSTGSPPSLTQAIQVAGGFTASANISQIQIRRTTRTGSPQSINVNLLQLIQVGDFNQDVILQEGDTVFIPTATDVNPAEASIIAASTLRPQTTEPLKVAVVGEVFRPGTYTVKGESSGTNGSGSLPTLTQAIKIAGGIKPLADLRQIQVRRSTRTGSNQVIDVNLWELLQAGDISQDVLLQEGDRISVPTAANIDPAEAQTIASASISPDTIQVQIVGEVKSPGTVKVQPNTPLNQALLAAGGFDNRRARKSSVELIRLNPNGTVSQRQVEVAFNQGINEQSNPLLQNNDVIVVGRSNLARVTDTLGTVLSPVGSIFSLFNFFRIFQ